jgi:hypothetical protein
MNLTHTIAHYFYPRHSNDHKAKFLHTSTLFLLVGFLIVFQVVLQALPYSGVGILGYAANIPPAEIISLTNQKRAESGLSPLGYNDALSQAARVKGEHMLANNYWAHIAPDGTEPWGFFIDAGYKYRYAGENLARDFSNPQSAIDAWLASPSHKDNLLSEKYNEIGVAVVEGDLGGVDTTIIVQLFGTQLGDTSTSVPIAQAKPETSIIPTNTPTPTNLLTISPTFAPTATVFVAAPVTPFVSPAPKEVLVTAEAPQTSREGFRVLVSPFDTTRGVSLVTIVLLLGVMIVDGVVTSRKRITRIGGRTFAHLAFLGMILTIVFIARAGQIL